MFNHISKNATLRQLHEFLNLGFTNPFFVVFFFLEFLNFPEESKTKTQIIADIF